LATPGSRYGWTSAHVAPLVYRVARIDGDTSKNNIDFWMRLAVNDSAEPQEKINEYAVAQSGADVDAVVRGYLECQLWAQRDYSRADADTGDGPALDENYGVDDIADEYVDVVRDEITALIVAHPLAVRMYLAKRDADSFGHDFYLTREGHGAGFWDRGLGELGDYLTKIAKWSGAASDLDDYADTGVLSA
jgi:hypothetical protein